MTPSRAAVDAGAEALCLRERGRPLNAYALVVREDYAQQSEAVLTAALPLLLADADAAETKRGGWFVCRNDDEHDVEYVMNGWGKSFAVPMGFGRATAAAWTRVAARATTEGER